MFTTSPGKLREHYPLPVKNNFWPTPANAFQFFSLSQSRIYCKDRGRVWNRLHDLGLRQ